MSRERPLRLHDLVAASVSRSPGAVALVDDREDVSYAVLEDRARRLAAQLQADGVRRGSVVAISMPRNPGLAIALYAILKAGGAYAALDASYPDERIAHMLGSVGARHILVDEAGASRFELFGTPLLIFDELERRPQQPGAAIDRTDEGDLACIMFTSGSTGLPKPVAVMHRNIVNLVCGQEYCRPRGDDTFLHLAPLTFDASTFEIWMPLAHSARLAFHDCAILDIEHLSDCIRRHRVSVLWLTAGLFHLIVEEDVYCLRPLRQLLAGGDVLSPRHVKRVLDHLDCQVTNGYGPTECTTFSLCYHVTRDFDPGRPVPIGTPLRNVRAYVLDEQLQPVPAGESGELYIGGLGVSGGYVGDEAATARRFLPDPFGAEGFKMYRTGDLVQVRANGEVEFIGRADRQVKIRGHRVEPGEVEAALLRHPGVRSGAVDVEGPAESISLVAYFVPANEEVDAASIRAHLRGILPAYMIPARILEVAALPLTRSGKFDRSALALEARGHAP